MKKLLCTVLSTVLAISSAAALNMSAYADSANTQQVSYNYWYNSSTGYRVFKVRRDFYEKTFMHGTFDSTCYIIGSSFKYVCVC